MEQFKAARKETQAAFSEAHLDEMEAEIHLIGMDFQCETDTSAAIRLMQSMVAHFDCYETACKINKLYLILTENE